MKVEAGWGGRERGGAEYAQPWRRLNQRRNTGCSVARLYLCTELVLVVDGLVVRRFCGRLPSVRRRSSAQEG